MKKILLFALIFLFSILVVTAQTNYGCPVKAKSKYTIDFLNEIPDLNDAGKSCPATLQGAVSALVGSGIIQVDIAMNDGSTEQFIMVKSGNQITEIKKDPALFYHYLIYIDESSVDQLLQSSNRFGTFSTLYQQKKIKISGGKFLSKVRLAVAKPFLGFFTKRNQIQLVPPQASGRKPDNCDDTYLPGHNGYQQNQALWDSYSANTNGVCQSQFGKGIPSPCVYTVQLSVSGNPYYLCWYNN